jgi:hypothetical protein
MSWDKTKPAAATPLKDSNPELLANFAAIEALIASIADPTKWHVDADGLVHKTAQNGVTAHAGGGQGSAVAITGDVVEIATCASGGDSIILPAAEEGMNICVINHGAESADIFPATGEDINEAAANAAIACAADATRLFFCYADGHWESVILART